MGDYFSAQAYLQQSLTIYRAVEDRDSEAICLRRLGSIAGELGETSKAEELLQQALAIHRNIGRRKEAITDLRTLGEIFTQQGAPKKSLIHLSEAVALSRATGLVEEESICLLPLSRAHRALGEIERPKEVLQTLLPLSQRLRNRLLEAGAQHDLALIALQKKHYEEAQACIEAALHIIENSRTGLIHPEARAQYRSNTQSYYELYTDILARRALQNNDPQLAAQALESVERSRARSLLQLLAEGRVDIRQGVDAELLKREREFERRISAKEERLQQLSTRKSDEEQAKGLQAEITTLTADLREVESRIRVASPAYAAITQPQPLKLAEIQQKVLDSDTLLLEYALGQERSYLFAATPASLKIFVLPKRAEIEATVRQYYALVEKQNALPVFSDLTQRQKLVRQLEQDQQRVAQTLSQMLLLPAAKEFRQKRLLIVPDGALHYVPFAALPEWRMGERERGGVGDKEQKNRPLALSPSRPLPLIVNHEILTLPSASTLAIARQQWAGRKAAPKILALFADPVFGKEDGRVTAPMRSPGDEDVGPRFARLLATQQEAAAIQAFVPPTQRLVAVGFEATRTLALSDQLTQYRYLHFATHGIWNESFPARSGLLLSQIDQEGKAQNGLLTTRDIFNLKLAAELVVLSGCQTALGKELRGEGLVGLTRGFLYAGARRVVASLWQVNDVATAKLMEKFYQGMWERQLSPAAALRAAQIAMWQDKRWGASYYWAAFTLQGEFASPRVAK